MRTGGEELEVKCGIGSVATVYDRVGNRRSLGRLESSHRSGQESRMGKARSRHLQKIVSEIAEIREGGGR